jgi:putative ABC transport system substrate-binding protein
MRHSRQATRRADERSKPSRHAVEQPTRFELVVNLVTAKAIGHEITAGLALRAEKAIE